MTKITNQTRAAVFLFIVTVLFGIQALCSQASAWTPTTVIFDWETAADNGTAVTETISAITATVSTDGSGIDMDTAGIGWHGTTGNYITASSDSTTVTVTFSEAVDVVCIYAVNTGSGSGMWTFTPTGTATNTVTAAIDDTNVTTIYPNWSEVTSFTVTSDNANSAFGFDDLVIDTQDATTPTLVSAQRSGSDDDTLIIELSEDCTIATQSNDGGFTVTKTGSTETYQVNAVKQGKDGQNYVELSVDTFTDAEYPGLTVTYTAGGNGTIADTAGNAMATDTIGVEVPSWDIPLYVESFTRSSPTEEITNAESITFKLLFSETVGIYNDIVLTTTGTLTGTHASSTIKNGILYLTYRLNNGTGTARLDISENARMTDVYYNPIISPYTGGETYTVDREAPTLVSASKTNDYQLTVTLSEQYTNISSTDGDSNGFTITKTGTSETYDINSVTVYPDSNIISLNTADLSRAAAAGLTITYTAGGSGNITDSIGNALATDTTGVTVAAWNATPVMTDAVRDSDTQITVELNDDCLNLDQSGDGGFSVIQTNTSTAYTVTQIEQGTDASHVVLTVEDMASAGSTGVTVLYTAGGNGTICSTAGTSMETDTVGIAIPGWENALPTLVSAQRSGSDDDTLIIELSEDCIIATQSNDGGFTVTKTGSTETYQVNAVKQGTDGQNYVELSVDTFTDAEYPGLTVTYTAGGNATITDTAGNAMATDTIGVEVPSWDIPLYMESITRSSPTEVITNAESITFKLSFSEAFGRLDDIVLTTTGTLTGRQSSVALTGNTLYMTYKLNNGTGTAWVDIPENTRMTDVYYNPIISPYTGGETYTVDREAPTLVSASKTNDYQLTVTLSEQYTNISSTDGDSNGFTITKTGTSETYDINSVTVYPDSNIISLNTADLSRAAAAGLTITYTAGGSGNITDSIGNAMATDATGVTVPAWDTAPAVESISRYNPLPAETNAENVTFRVTFSEEVSGVNASDFTLTKTGDATGAIASITTSDNTIFDVVVNSVSGNGTLRLDLDEAYTYITDTAGFAIASGFSNGETYTVDNTAPSLTGVVRDSDTQITLTLNEDCLNIAKSNDGGFTVTQTGSAQTFKVTSVAEGSIILTVENMSSAYSTGVTISYTAGGNGTITDLAGNALTSSENEELQIEPWTYEHPQTGDSFTMLLWLFLSAGSAAMAVTIARLYKGWFRGRNH